MFVSMCGADSSACMQPLAGAAHFLPGLRVVTQALKEEEEEEEERLRGLQRRASLLRDLGIVDQVYQPLKGTPTYKDITVPPVVKTDSRQYLSNMAAKMESLGDRCSATKVKEPSGLSECHPPSTVLSQPYGPWRDQDWHPQGLGHSVSTMPLQGMCPKWESSAPIQSERRFLLPSNASLGKLGNHNSSSSNGPFAEMHVQGPAPHHPEASPPQAAPPSAAVLVFGRDLMWTKRKALTPAAHFRLPQLSSGNFVVSY
ncbi:uncharacterized protein LOC123481155 [Coregonus clupeaformis]|uniref:uncharacterized protein LOC123481155 n=1 Tax=Coregonus clupeaformis TaxID=59861 RepID=UPI001E1C3120|nr:uncharacterized protein LOC123481155 [Coregonus clupeaformis]